MKNLTKVRIRKNGLECGALLAILGAETSVIDFYKDSDNDIVKVGGALVATGLAIGGWLAALSTIEDYFEDLESEATIKDFEEEHDN